jgi:hypothetical protein
MEAAPLAVVAIDIMEYLPLLMVARVSLSTLLDKLTRKNLGPMATATHIATQFRRPA